MYIPAIFSTSQNGCPSGSQPYYLYNYTVYNYNSGARGRVTINWNTPGSNQVVGENRIALGSYSGAEIANESSVGFTALENPSILPYPEFGIGGATPTSEIGPITGSNTLPIVYCYDCTKKYRWTFGSKAGLDAPWPQFATPLTLTNFSSASGSKNNSATYKQTTLDFNYTQTGSVEGYGPIWQANPQSGVGNAASYYIISREDITPTRYTIQNCATSVTASIALSGSQTLNVGTVFKAIGSGITGSCWSVLNSFQNDLIPSTYSNVVTSSTFVDCDTCEAKYELTDCATLENYIVKFSGIVPSNGTVFKSNTSGLVGKCLTMGTLVNSTTALNYNNVTTSSTFVDCDTCEAKYELTDCATLEKYVVTFSGSAPTNGTVFKSSTSGLVGKCLTLNSLTSSTSVSNYTNVITSSTFVDCDTCEAKYELTDCDTSDTYVVTFSGSIPIIGNTFKATSTELNGKCLTLNSLTSSTSLVDYTNLTASSSVYPDCVSCITNLKEINYLIVAGGGGGGTTTGGGGGAGGYVASVTYLQSGSYNINVGSGGAVATNGQTSSFHTYSALGGGFGGYGTTATPYGTGSVGGSGGGGTGGVSNTIISGSTGTVGQGFAGGEGRQLTGNNQSAGGGGGASQKGLSFGLGNGQGGDGGSGSQWLDGNFYAGGGGGAYSRSGDGAGDGGIGGGGKGASEGVTSAQNGTTNTGGGGGGGINATYTAGSGGSGIVKLRYESGSIMNATGGTILVSGSYVYHTFTGSGAFTF